jgi:tripartite-type tricarboxylate transporter receptor subunit TctC
MPAANRLLPSRAALIVCTVAAALAGVLPRPAGAQGVFPSKTIRLVLPQPAGGAVDLIARTLGDRLADNLKTAVVVDNQPGANGSLAAGSVTRAAPDGHTLFFAIDTNLVVNPHLYANLSYDPFKDLAPISVVATLDTVLVVNPSVPAKDVAELIAYARANPDKLNYASVGLGSLMHLGMELFMLRTGTRLTHVPYRGTAPATTDLVAGVVQAMFTGPQAAQPLIEGGQLRGLAVAGLRRSELMPQMPTMTEAGVDNLQVSGWFGVMAPAQTPAAVISRLSTEIGKVTIDAGFKSRLAAQGIAVRGSTANEMAALMRSDSAMWRDLIKSAGISIPR